MGEEQSVSFVDGKPETESVGVRLDETEAGVQFTEVKEEDLPEEVREALKGVFGRLRKTLDDLRQDSLCPHGKTLIDFIDSGKIVRQKAIEKLSDPETDSNEILIGVGILRATKYLFGPTV